MSNTLCLPGPASSNESVYHGVATRMSFMEKFSNRATPVKRGLIICAPRAKLTLSGVVSEGLTDAWGACTTVGRKKSHLITDRRGQGECLMLFSPTPSRPGLHKHLIADPESRSFLVPSAPRPWPLSPGCFEVMMDEVSLVAVINHMHCTTSGAVWGFAPPAWELIIISLVAKGPVVEGVV